VLQLTERHEEQPFEALFELPLRNGIHKKKNFHGSGVPIINMGELFDGDRIRIPPENLIEVTDSELERFGIEQGDLLFARRSLVLEGSGKTSLVEELGTAAVFESSVIRVRLDRTKADPDYYLAFFSSPEGRSRVLSIASQTAVSGIRGSDLAKLFVPVPPVQLQREVGRALKGLDDLIENNRRRIELLEETARLLYREWFVHFRYPGHEDVPLVDSALGLLPEDWEQTPLGEILGTLESGSRPRGGVGDLSEGVPSVGAENINGLGVYDFSKEKFISEEFFSSMKRGVVEPYDVLLYKDGAHIGRSAMFGEAFPHCRLAINEHVFRLRSNGPMGQCFLYLWLSDQSTFHRVRQLNSNAAQPGISQKKLLTLTMAVPAAELLGAFESQVRPLVEALLSLASQNKLLAEARDLLLPRLVSGDLDVSDLELDLEAVG